MRKMLATAALVLALGCPVLAGEIHIPAPAPPPPNGMREQVTESEVPNLSSDDVTTAEMALNVLLNMLALL